MNNTTGNSMRLSAGGLRSCGLFLPVIALLMLGIYPGPVLAQQQNLWRSRRATPRFNRSWNRNTSTYQVHQNRLRQVDRFGTVTEHKIRELQIGPRGQYSATVIDRRGLHSTIDLPKDKTLGVQPLDSNQITVTDALKRKQTIEIERITYDALGNPKVIYKDPRGAKHETPIEAYQGLKPGLETLYSKSVDIQDELGQIQTVRLVRLFRDKTGALKAEVVGPEGLATTVDAAQIVGTIPETLVPPPPGPPGPTAPEEPSEKEPSEGTPSESTLFGPRELEPPTTGQ